MTAILKQVTLFCLFFFSTNILAAQENIGILVFDGVLTSDITAPVEVFGAASKKTWFSNYKVILIAATEKTQIVTEEGLVIVADTTIHEDISLSVLIAPSAYNMKPLLKDKQLISFIRNQGSKVKWVASNCSGSFLLSEAGLLDGKNATTWAGGESELQRKYPNLKVKHNTNVVVDKGVITSNGSVVSYQAALTLLAKLSSASLAQEVADSIQWQRLKTAKYSFLTQ